MRIYLYILYCQYRSWLCNPFLTRQRPHRHLAPWPGCPRPRKGPRSVRRKAHSLQRWRRRCEAERFGLKCCPKWEICCPKCPKGQESSEKVLSPMGKDMEGLKDLWLYQLPRMSFWENRFGPVFSIPSIINYVLELGGSFKPFFKSTNGKRTSMVPIMWRAPRP